MEIKKITSAQNEYIKMLSKLSSKKNREEAGLFLAEGEHLTEMVLGSLYEVKNLIMTEDYYAKMSIYPNRYTDSMESQGKF